MCLTLLKSKKNTVYYSSTTAFACSRLSVRQVLLYTLARCARPPTATVCVDVGIENMTPSLDPLIAYAMSLLLVQWDLLLRHPLMMFTSMEKPGPTPGYTPKGNIVVQKMYARPRIPRVHTIYAHIQRSLSGGFSAKERRKYITGTIMS